MHRTAALLTLAAASHAHAALYSQPSDRPAQPSFFSDAVAGQFFSQRMADNFTLANAGTATALRWWGGSQNFQFADTVNMASYTVVIYAAAPLTGAPDTANILFQATVSTEDAGLDVTATGFSNVNGGIEYRYTLTLDNALQLDAATPYWISVGATLVNPSADAWVWSGSTVGDLVNATDFFGSSGYTVFDPTANDMAFEIIPAPGPLAVFAAGLTLAARRRR